MELRRGPQPWHSAAYFSVHLGIPHPPNRVGLVQEDTEPQEQNPPTSFRSSPDCIPGDVSFHSHPSSTGLRGNNRLGDGCGRHQVSKAPHSPQRESPRLRQLQDGGSPFSNASFSGRPP